VAKCVSACDDTELPGASLIKGDRAVVVGLRDVCFGARVVFPAGVVSAVNLSLARRRSTAWRVRGGMIVSFFVTLK